MMMMMHIRNGWLKALLYQSIAISILVYYWIIHMKGFIFAVFCRHKQGALDAHPSWHQMVLDEKSAPFVDGDYMSFELQQGKYNYLDPNFTPNVR